METSLRGLMGGRVESGITKCLEAFYQRVTGISLQNAVPRELLENGVQYEVSKTYRVMKSEIECQRASGVVEVRRQCLRGF